MKKSIIFLIAAVLLLSTTVIAATPIQKEQKPVTVISNIEGITATSNITKVFDKNTNPVAITHPARLTLKVKRTSVADNPEDFFKGLMADSGNLPPVPPPEYHKITQQEAKSIMDGGKPCVILDVREQNEYDAGHIENAILIPYTQIPARAEIELTDRNAVILVYCQGGVRSKIASDSLVALGYTNVYDFGGLNTWTYGTVDG